MIDVMIDTRKGPKILYNKTSDEVIAPESAKMQVKIYAYGLRFLGKPVSSGEVVYIEDSRVDPVSIRDQDIEESER